MIFRHIIGHLSVLQRCSRQFPLASYMPLQCAHYSDNRSPAKARRSLPAIMDFNEIFMPNLVKTIKNWIMVHFIIRPYFDSEFRLSDFVEASKQALEIISTCIANGGELKGLVTREAIKEIEQSVSRMSVAQRNEIPCIKDDIIYSFPYQVGIMFDEEMDQNVQRRWVEITVVHHVLRGFKMMRESGQEPPSVFGPEQRIVEQRMVICNYRFLKEYTKNQESDWICNVVNHWKPNDLYHNDQTR